MVINTRTAIAAFSLIPLLALGASSAQASLYSLTASGTISTNSSGDSTIPVGTPWTMKLIYDTAAPDLDVELTGSSDPTFGEFANTSTPPALTSFHYQAGTYEVTIDDPADFGTGSGIFITFTSLDAIDINIHAPGFFPPLAGGPVSFHADFNAFDTAPVLTSDGLPTNTSLTAESFDLSTVSLLPPSGDVSGSTLTSLSLHCAADANEDGAVDVTDLLHLLGNWGSPDGDINGDGNTDVTDLLALLAAWGSC